MSTPNATLKEAKRLHDLGFAILWLHPRSKRPIGNEWGSGPRKDWKTLSASYQPGFNMGVRLGTASKLQKGFLCVVDVDVKSDEARHKKEAIEALSEIMGFTGAPEVRSGRGNGSRHVYCVTEAPFKTWNPAQSSELVKYKSPSKNPSKKERESLSEKEIREGWRLGRAWEISLYSDGRQVVLPPSIHPDTGKPYFWKEPLLDGASLRLVGFGQGPESAAPKGESKKESGVDEGKTREVSEDLKVDETLDVRFVPGISEKCRALIVDGIWKGKKIEDRSAYLPIAAEALVSSGLERESVLACLTDPTTVLGECAFDHAQTKSRKRAALWVWKYTLKKIWAERKDAKAIFGEGEAAGRVLHEWEALEQEEEMREGEGADWKRYLDRTEKGKIKPTLNNCKSILENSCEGKNFVGRDEFANNDFYLMDTPWRSKKGESAITDIDVVRIKSFCAEKFAVEFSDNNIKQAVLDVADVNRFHPVRDYLKSLQWDGVNRIDTWLKDFAGAVGPEEYVRAVSRKVLVALIKRVMEPGCKFDHVLILEGNQGTGKSTLLSQLVGDKWFTDQPMVLGDKDSILTIQSKWLVELGELAALNRSELEHIKAFITQRTDRIRPPYGGKIEDYPRQTIFVGSTNLEEYLKDDTGNRRFWPVRCLGQIDFLAVGKIRDQLLAEAKAYYELGEPLYLETPELAALAHQEQEKRGEVDELTGAIAKILESEDFPKTFEMSYLSSSLREFGVDRLDRGDQMRVSRALKKLGFGRVRSREGGVKKWLWGKKQ